MLAELYPQAQVTGIDLSPYMLALAEYEERWVRRFLAGFLSVAVAMLLSQRQIQACSLALALTSQCHAATAAQPKEMYGHMKMQYHDTVHYV